MWRKTCGGMFLIFWATTASAQVCDEPFSRPSYPTRQAFCAVGEMVPDAYAPGELIRCEEMEVDHLISLRQAWASGVCGNDLKRLAKDPRNLRFTHWKTNRSKGYLSPDDFSQRLAPTAASNVRKDARELMKDYNIKSRDEAVLNRMISFLKKGATHSRIPIEKIPKNILKRITYKQIGGRTIAFVGKKAIGYAVGVGVAIEAVNVAGWAADWLMTPEQTDRMSARADMFKEIFGDEN